MSKMEDLKERAAQLRKPHGDNGLFIAEKMNEGNEMMCKLTYEKLELGKGHNTLEVGMGNGHFVPYLMSMKSETRYTGFDYSELMVEAAKQKNVQLLASGRVVFQHGSIDSLPFDKNQFDRICTSNTLYFWPNPKANMQALVNVLKPGGMILIAIRPKEIFDKLPVTQYGFTKYENSEVIDLMRVAGLINISEETVNEPDRLVEGEKYELRSTYFKGYLI